MIITEKKLDDIDLKILKLLQEGKPFKKIGHELNLSKFVVNNRVEAMRKYYNCENSIKLISLLTAKNILSPLSES